MHDEGTVPTEADGEDLSTFSDPIARALADIIHHTGSGGRLPTERDIAAQLGVSRNAVRDRLRLIQGMGIIARRQGSGTYVEPLNIDGLAMGLDIMLASQHLTLTDVHEVRVALERQAARLAARSITPEKVAALRAAVAALAQAGDDAATVDADWQFHHQLMQAGGNPALSFFAGAIQTSVRRNMEVGIRRWRQARYSQNLLVQLHADVVDAIAGGDELAAGGAVDAHFQMFLQRVDGGLTELRH